MRNSTPSLIAVACTFLLVGANLVAQPTVTGFSPSSGPVGTLVTITGTGLSAPTSLTIGGVTAIAVSNTGTNLVAMVMPGATSGNVSIVTGSGSATANNTYSVTASLVPNTQQGPKFSGSSGVGISAQGYSVAVSANGNTALVGGFTLRNSSGATWVFTRNGAVWSEQARLVGTGSVDTSYQGYSVSLSADGNTALVGANADSNYLGGAWVFTRNGTAWNQQAKLIGSDAIGQAYQGYSVSLSADGNTALVGGWFDKQRTGAAWVFTRTAGVWTQQGGKLVGSDVVGKAQFGVRVSLSADGNTALLGGNGDSNGRGAAWVFVRNGSKWNQEAKLFGIDTLGPKDQQGIGVCLNADGNTALVGAMSAYTGVGSARVYTRSGGMWRQETNLLSSFSEDTSGIGYSVSLNADGSAAVLGGYGSNGYVGVTYVFTRTLGIWNQHAKLVGTQAKGPSYQGNSVALSADGNLLLVGGPGDHFNHGAVWPFTFEIETSLTEPFQTKNSNSSLHLYPNPISRSQRLMLALPDRGAAATYIVEFVDASGRVALTHRGEVAPGSSEALLLSVSSLSPGSYIVRYTSGGISNTGRVLVTD